MFPERQQLPNTRRNPLFSISRPRQNTNQMNQSSWNPINQTTTSTSGFSKTLDNIQQVLKTIESGVPIVQEYGPMIKNLPAMYNMIKAFNDSEESSDKASDETLDENREDKKEEKTDSAFETETEKDRNDLDEVRDEVKIEKTKKETNPSNGKSIPKLFI